MRWGGNFGRERRKDTMVDGSLEKLFEFLDIFGQFCRRKLPVEAKIVKHAILRLPALWYLGVVIACGVIGPSGGSQCLRDFYLLALETVEDGRRVVIGKEVRAFRMHPAFALVTHDPFFSVVTEIEVDLLAVQAVTLLLVLPYANFT